MAEDLDTMSGPDPSWTAEKRERERAIVWLLRGVRHDKEDAWLEGWHGEGLKRRGAIRGRKERPSKRIRYMGLPQMQQSGIC